MSAAEKVFLDTNVLVYAHDRSEPVKGPQAQTLLLRIAASGRPLVSTQVLSEFYWATTRKIPQPLSHDEASAELGRLNALCRVVPLTWETLERTLQLVAAYKLPLWDAQILAAATLNGGAWLLSEDFQDGQVMEGVTILNPFAPGFDIARILPP